MVGHRLCHTILRERLATSQIGIVHQPVCNSPIMYQIKACWSCCLVHNFDAIIVSTQAVCWCIHANLSPKKSAGAWSSQPSVKQPRSWVPCPPQSLPPWNHLRQPIQTASSNIILEVIWFSSSQGATTVASGSGSVRPSPTMQVLMWKRWSSAAVCLEVRELEILERSLPTEFSKSFHEPKSPVEDLRLHCNHAKSDLFPISLSQQQFALRCPCQISPRNKDHMPAIRIPKLTLPQKLWHHGNIGKHESTAMELPWNACRMPMHTSSEFG